MHEVKPKAELIGHSYGANMDNLQKIYAGFRRCYSDEEVPEYRPATPLDVPEVETFIRKMRKTPHESPLEHASLTWHITCSRACSHQLVRHRIASYSQQSQRYVRMNDLPVIVPPSIAANADLKSDFLGTMVVMEAAYKEIADICDVAIEDARFILPTCTATQIVTTMNFRSLLHFFNERCCNRAQWEIRDLANQMLDICKRLYPCVFENAGPHCLKIKHCPEHKPCGKQPWKEQ